MTGVIIPEPCPRKSATMIPVDSGFYCDTCSKLVIDFRRKSNHEILDAIRKQTEQPCGIFDRSQVVSNRPFTDQLIRFAAALLLVFGTVLFQSCGNEEEVAGKMCISDSQQFVDSMEEVAAMQKIKADSAWLADSVAKADTAK